MTNVKKNRASNCTGERSFSRMTKIKSVLRSSMAQERMYNLALLNTEEDIVHKWTLPKLLIYSQLQEKTVLSVLF